DEGPLFRAILLEGAPFRTELVLLAHHLACDGWSLGVFVQELLTLYRDPAAVLDEAPRFTDYAQRDRAPIAPETEQFWRRQFEGSVPRMELPAERARGPVRDYRAARVDVDVDPALVAEVRRFAAKQQVTFVAAMLAGAAATVSRLCGEDDVVLALPSAGQATLGMPGLVGHCVNVLPVRLYVDAQESVGALVRRAGTRLLDVQEHARFTLGRLLRTVALPRVPGRIPVTPVMFNVDQGLKLDTLLAGTALRGEVRTIPRVAEYFELFLNLVQHEGRPLVIECQYNAHCFSEALVREWLAGYVALLASMVADADRPAAALDAIPPATRARLDGEWQGPSLAAAPPATVHEWILRTAAASPTAIAVRDAAGTLTYAALVAQARALGEELQRAGVAPGDRVALSVSRSRSLPVALLATLAAGATYVPIDPEYPRDRVRFMLEDAAPRVWLVEGALPEFAPPGTAVLDLAALPIGARASAAAGATAGANDALVAADIAYLIHTSGSTGRPKGVIVPHAAVTNFLAAMAAALPIGPSDRVLALTTLSFDIAALELLLPLVTGASVFVVDRTTARDPRALADAIAAQGITLMQATPSTYRMLLDDGWVPPAGLKALCGGEALPAELAARLHRGVARLWNVFGPTETTIWSTIQEITAVEAVVPIGRPIARTQVEVVDARDRRVPVGVPGELLIGGDGVARGYHARPELTAERFVAHPLAHGARMYRTGDLAAWRPDGTLVFLGRADAQVKIRGFRVELGEVESVLAAMPEVAVAGARLWDDGQGDARIAAYVVPAAGRAVDAEAMLRRLRALLPSYMVPQHLVTLAAMPLTPNGKLDRAALPSPMTVEDTPDDPAEWSERERLVARVWTEVLGAPVTRRSADFFALGGHSILVGRVIS
ncbi:MAG: amino acid adenylation domain-containing protein, partial [Gemmatimonadaceae bacterium]|nr:amino acid adenylation domain-containing protein [Gemmatimonadaceae bacterium]